MISFRAHHMPQQKDNIHETAFDCTFGTSLFCYLAIWPSVFSSSPAILYAWSLSRRLSFVLFIDSSLLINIHQFYGITWISFMFDILPWMCISFPSIVEANWYKCLLGVLYAQFLHSTRKHKRLPIYVFSCNVIRWWSWLYNASVITESRCMGVA